jgi:hypothetical protein
MTIDTSAVTVRTLYMERVGDKYTIVRVWEAGQPVTETDVAFCIMRASSTSVDERVIAVQIAEMPPLPTRRVFFVGRTEDVHEVRRVFEPALPVAEADLGAAHAVLGCYLAEQTISVRPTEQGAVIESPDVLLLAQAAGVAERMASGERFAGEHTA